MLGMCAIGALNDGGYAKVVANFDRAVDMCHSGHIKLECDDGVSKTNCQTSPNNPEMYTMINRISYNARSPMYICKSLCSAKGSITTDLAHELGRYIGKQGETSTNDPLWDVNRWDYYIAMLTTPGIINRLEEQHNKLE